VLVELPTAGAVEEVNRLLDLAFDPHTAAWELDSAGTWTQATSPDDDPMRNLQETLISLHKRRRSRLA
jgi:polyphosphate kinase